MDQYNTLLDLLYTPLDLPPPPAFNMGKLHDYIISTYDKDGSVYKTNQKTMDTLKNDYPWNITHVYYNMTGEGPGWMNGFETMFPELAEYFSTVLSIPITEFGHIMMLPIKKGHTGIGFWHTDGDSFGIRMYLEYEHIGRNKLLMKRTKLPYVRKQGFIIPVAEDLLQDEEIDCKVISNQQWFYLNNIRALHTTWTEVEDSTRIAVFFCSRKDNWAEFVESTTELILSSAAKFKEEAVYWSSNKLPLNTSMIAYMPKPTLVQNALNKQFNAYKSFLELGGLEVTHDPDKEAKIVLSERESWVEINEYFTKFNRTNMPLVMCDKSESNAVYRAAGIDTLPWVLPESESDFTPFLDVPVILKPRVSGGGISTNPIAYKVFDSGRLLLETLRKEQPLMLGRQSMFIKTNNYASQLVLQQAVTSMGVEFGQLYTEGFVNGKGELVISSVHEIGFLESRWTEQKPMRDEDRLQIESIKKSLSLLVSQTGIKNCLFLLQWVRDLSDGKWYPTDWQYRLSYNSLWGRQYFEEEYCNQLVKFMSDQIPRVTTTSSKFYFQKYIVVDTTKSKENLVHALEECKVVYAPFPKSLGDSTDKHLFISSGNTFEEAKSNMDKFEKKV